MPLLPAVVTRCPLFPQVCLLLHRVLLSFAALWGYAPSKVWLAAGRQPHTLSRLRFVAIQSQWATHVRVLVEFCVLVLPQLLVMTVLADYAVAALVALLAVVVALHAAAVAVHGRPLLSTRFGVDHALWHLLSERKMTFVNNFRSGMMIAT